jgi:hypothetical protein
VMNGCDAQGNIRVIEKTLCFDRACLNSLDPSEHRHREICWP